MKKFLDSLVEKSHKNSKFLIEIVLIMDVVAVFLSLFLEIWISLILIYFFCMIPSIFLNEVEKFYKKKRSKEFH